MRTPHSFLKNQTHYHGFQRRLQNDPKCIFFFKKNWDDWTHIPRKSLQPKKHNLMLTMCALQNNNNNFFYTLGKCIPEGFEKKKLTKGTMLSPRSLMPACSRGVRQRWSAATTQRFSVSNLVIRFLCELKLILRKTAVFYTNLHFVNPGTLLMRRRRVKPTNSASELNLRRRQSLGGEDG